MNHHTILTQKARLTDEFRGDLMHSRATGALQRAAMNHDLQGFTVFSNVKRI